MTRDGPVIKIRNVLVIRGRKVATVVAVSAFYGVAPGVLLRAVARKRRRFTEEFMFYPERGEIESLSDEYRKKRLPVFTESGVAMLSTVLQTPKAIQTHIEIIRQMFRLLKFGKQ